MTEEARPVVTLGVDAGGRDADIATREHYLALRRLLAQECRGPYSDVLKEVAFILRIDGSVQAWHQLGLRNVRLQKKAGYATGDVFVPAEVWQAGAGQFRHFLVVELTSAASAIAARAAARQVPFNGDRFVTDVCRATDLFVAEHP